MAQLLEIREIVITFVKRYETVFRFVLKLIVALFLFGFINRIGGYDEKLAPLFEGSMSIPFYLFMSLLFAIFPPTLGNLLISVEIVLQISSSPITALVVGLLLSMVLLFYSRLDPQKSYLIIAVVLGFYFKIPYAAVIFAGLYMGLTSIIPVSIGTFLWNFIPLSQQLFNTAKMPDETDLMALPTTFIDIYESLFQALTTNFEWVFYCFIFAMVIICVHFVSRLSINYSKEIAILLGGLVSIFSMTVAAAVVGISTSLIGAIFFSLLSALIMEAVSFLDLALDYNKSEKIQFEDDEYYYYVKAVPKIMLAAKPAEEKEAKPEAEVELPRYRDRVRDVNRDSDRETRRSVFLKEDLYDEDLDTIMPVRRAQKAADIHMAEKSSPRPERRPTERIPKPSILPETGSPGVGKVKKRMTPEEFERYKARMEALNRPLPPVYKKGAEDKKPE